MFSNPFTAVMALIILAFVGTLVIFFCIWRELDALRRTVRDMRSHLHFVALDTEQQARDHAAILRELRQLTGNEADLGEMLEKGIGNLGGRFAPEDGGTALFDPEDAAAGSFANGAPDAFAGQAGTASSPAYPESPGLTAASGAEPGFPPVDAFTASAPEDAMAYGTVHEYAPLRFAEDSENDAPPAFPRGGKPGA